MTRSKGAFAVVAGGVLIAASVAPAELIVTESFNISPVGAPLDGNGTGAGWGGTQWSASDSGSGSFEMLGGQAFAAGDYGGLDISGRTPRRSLSQGTSEASRELGFQAIRNRVAAVGGETWFSVLVDFQGSNFAFALTSGAFQTGPSFARLEDTGQEDVGIGFRYRRSQGDLLLQKWVDGGALGQTSDTSLPISNGTMLLVGRIGWSDIETAGDELSLWIVPEAGGDLSVLDRLSMTTPVDNALLTSVAVFDNEKTRFDEIRFADVAPGETSQDALGQVTPGLAVVVPSPGVAFALVPFVCCGRRRA